MIYEVVPETMIWEYVGQNIGILPKRPILGRDIESGERTRLMESLGIAVPHSKSAKPVQAKLPASDILVENLSAEFIERWKSFATAMIQQKLAETFGFRTFLFIENDEVQRYSTADKAFWEKTGPESSHRVVARIWESLLQTLDKETQVAYPLLKPADAMLLCSILPDLTSKYSFEWLVTNRADWSIIAYFLFAGTFFLPFDLPWKIFFEAPENVCFTLKEPLIEKTAEFFQIALEKMQAFFDPEHSADQLEWQPSGDESGIMINFYRLDEIVEFTETLEHTADIVKTGVRYWMTRGSIAYNDADYIEGAISRYSLFNRIDALTASAREFCAAISLRNSEGETDPHE